MYTKKQFELVSLHQLKTTLLQFWRLCAERTWQPWSWTTRRSGPRTTPTTRTGTTTATATESCAFPAHSSPGFSYAFFVDFTSAVDNISLHFDTFHKFFLLDMRILLITIHQQLLVHKYDYLIFSKPLECRNVYHSLRYFKYT